MNSSSNSRSNCPWQRRVLIFSLALSMPLAAAEIYRKVDEQGNVSFSDTAEEGAEPVAVEPINLDESHKVTGKLPPLSPQPPDTTVGYTSLEIISPQNETTLRNQNTLTLTAQLKPGLKQKHRVQFTDHGQALGSPSTSLSYTISNLERGSHLYQVQVTDSRGKVLITSAPVTVHAHRTSVVN